MPVGKTLRLLAVAIFALLCLYIVTVRSSVVNDVIMETRIVKLPFVNTSKQIVDVIMKLANIFGRGSVLLLAAEGILVGTGIYYIYKILLTPMNRVRHLGDIGYIKEPGVRRTRDMVNVVQKRRAVGQIPPVYPNGWFCIIESRDLAKGEVKGVSCVGKNLAVFRGEDGQVQAIDAYCPHMGANLAAGGLVKGNCLECPFHGWRFRGEDGKCVHIPYCEDKKYIPESARVTSYCVLERNGFVYMWHHAEGNEPDWFPPEIPEITSGKWTYRGRIEHIINAHIEEIPENGADVAHLKQLHGPFMASGIDLRTSHSKYWKFVHHDWSGNWEASTEDKHIGVLSLHHTVRLFGLDTKLFNMNVTAQQIGPGIVYLTFDSPFGSAAYLQAVTPVEPLVQRMINQVYFSTRTPTFIAKFFLLGEALQIERDVMVWNNKTYQHKPVFVKSREDTLVAKHRRWYSQFYSENSPKLAEANSMTLEW